MQLSQSWHTSVNMHPELMIARLQFVAGHMGFVVSHS